jgi:hypothetical protein
VSTSLVATGLGGRFDFSVNDANHDAKPDIYVIDRLDSGIGITNISILNGATDFNEFLLPITNIAVHDAGLDHQYEFQVGHFDFDGQLDLYVLQTFGATSGAMEVSVYNGADQFQSTLYSNATALLSNSSLDRAAFILGLNNPPHQHQNQLDVVSPS